MLVVLIQIIFDNVNTLVFILRSQNLYPFQVWRFFITFADVLGLWPFTLDEFVQAFHDYVSFMSQFCFV